MNGVPTDSIIDAPNAASSSSLTRGGYWTVGFGARTAAPCFSKSAAGAAGVSSRSPPHAMPPSTGAAALVRIAAIMSFAAPHALRVARGAGAGAEGAAAGVPSSSSMLAILPTAAVAPARIVSSSNPRVIVLRVVYGCDN